MVVGRFIGWVMLFVGLIVLGRDLAVLAIGYDLFASLDTRHSAPIVLGELWYAVHPASLQLLQPAIQRHIHPALWDWIVQPMLLWWASAAFIGAGILLLALFRRHDTRRGGLH
jgi:hypothetical protein